MLTKQLARAARRDPIHVVAAIALLHAIDATFPSPDCVIRSAIDFGASGELLVDYAVLRRRAGDTPSTQELVDLAENLWTGGARCSLYRVMGSCDERRLWWAVRAINCFYLRGGGEVARKILEELGIS